MTVLFTQCFKRRKRRNIQCQLIRIITAFFLIITGQTTKKVEKCHADSFVGLTIGEKSYTVLHHKCMKENVISSEISIPNKAEMLFQMEQHWRYFRTRVIKHFKITNFNFDLSPFLFTVMLFIAIMRKMEMSFNLRLIR